MAGEREAVKAAIAFALESDPNLIASVIVEPIVLQPPSGSSAAVFLRTPHDHLGEALEAPRQDRRIFTLELICVQDFGAAATMPTVDSVDDLADQVGTIVEGIIPALMSQETLPPTAAFLLDWQYVETVRLVDSEGNRHRAAAVVRYDITYEHHYYDPADFDDFLSVGIDHDLAETTAPPPDASDEIELEQ